MLFLFTTYLLETTVEVRVAERREEAEYINSISKAEACVYCDTVLFVAEGGFPFRQHQCGLLSSLSGYQYNCVCLNDVCCRESKSEPGSCRPLTLFLLQQPRLQQCETSCLLAL